MRTIAGRLYPPPNQWGPQANQSYQWTSIQLINETVNTRLRARWEEVRSALAVNGRFEDTYDSGGLVGRGFINAGALGLGPVRPAPHATSWVTLTLELIQGAPPRFYIVRAFPTGVPGGMGG